MTENLSRRRQHGHAFGLWAEGWCRLDLRLRGYHICGTRYRTPLGEIDIVARRRDVVAVIEVKARRAVADAAAAVSPAQQARIARAARLLLAQHPAWQGRALRFDVMLVAPWRWPRHITRAWEG